MRDAKKELDALKLTVVGVSMDKVEDQKKFADKEKFEFTLLADTEGKVVKGFGVAEMAPGIPKRQSFLVKDGKVVWRDLEVKPGTHLEKVKMAIAELAKAEEQKPSDDGSEEKPAEEPPKATEKAAEPTPAKK